MKDKLIRFMDGRYGMDQLFCALSGVFLLLVFLNLTFQSWIIFIAELLVLGETIFRMLSKKLDRRQRENELFLSKVGKFKALTARNKMMKEQSETFYFKKCPGCKKTLRLPRVEGKHNTVCPNCGKTMTVNIKKG
ncbi:MAG: hypothetical protein K6B74_07110 [Ruminococcus sp.]|nr:hypothetical protein [Ruminococcus sp.]